MGQKQLLANVAVIRPILIVLLVFYHAFAPYSGAWAPIEGFPKVPTYWWLDWLSYAFMLEMFVFVSGYVFGYQVRTKGEIKLEAKNLFWGKFKRLMIPCMVFSLLYILLFGNITQPATKTLYSLVNGAGHMWFLPMLFWCFAGIWVIERLRLKSRWVILFFILCSIFSFVPLPLRMGNAMYYMLFFYVGYILQKEYVSLDRFYTTKHCIVAIVAFCVLFPTLTLLKTNIGNSLGGGLINKVLSYSFAKLLQIIYSSTGLMMLFVLVGTILKGELDQLPQWILKVGELCMGVYLLQQFVLVGIYEHTTMPSIAGCYLLPWIGLVVALVGSLALSYLLNKTKIGRFFIG